MRVPVRENSMNQYLHRRKARNGCTWFYIYSVYHQSDYMRLGLFPTDMWTVLQLFRKIVRIVRCGGTWCNVYHQKVDTVILIVFYCTVLGDFYVFQCRLQGFR